MFREPVLTSAIADCYFNSRQKSVLPLHHFHRWTTLLAEGVLCVSSSLLIDCIIPAWYRLCPPQGQRVAPAILCPGHITSLNRKGPSKKQKNKKYVQEDDGDKTTYLRGDIPLPEHLQNDPDLASFVALKLPPPEQIRFIVISVEMQNNTNWCILSDIEARSCELVSCVSQKIEQRTLDEIVGAARWFVQYTSLKSCQTRHCFRNDIPFYYCTLLSMYYTHQRISLAVSAENVMRSLSHAQILSFLDNFCVRQSLQRLSAVGEPQTLQETMQRMRIVAQSGKQRMHVKQLSEAHRRYITDKLGFSVETHPKKPEKLYITWK